MSDAIELAVCESDLINMTRKAARLANALRDIYNEIGEEPVVKTIYQAVEHDVDDVAELEDYAKERTCRACGCTDNDCSGCIRRTGHPCHWVAINLCSACKE